MNSALFRFYQELNDFLPHHLQHRDIIYEFFLNPSVKDAIEAQGIPHGEVDLILANGTSVDFSYRLQKGDRISVYPVFESINIAGITPLHSQPLRHVRFIADINLGRLAKYLRMAGFNTLLEKDDKKIATLSVSESRIILTRDLALLKRSEVTRGYWVRSTNVGEQLREVVHRFALAGILNPFTLCLNCNIPLEVALLENLVGLPEPVLKNFKEFTRCPLCRRIFWKGSHWKKMIELIGSLPHE